MLSRSLQRYDGVKMGQKHKSKKLIKCPDSDSSAGTSSSGDADAGVSTKEPLVFDLITAGKKPRGKVKLRRSGTSSNASTNSSAGTNSSAEARHFTEDRMRPKSAG